MFYRPIIVKKEFIKYAIGILLHLSYMSAYPQQNISSNKKTNNDSVLYFLNKSKEYSLMPNEKSSFLKTAYKRCQIIQDDSLKIRYLSKLSLASLKLKDSNLFRKFNSETIKLALKKYDSVILAESYWDLATFFRNNTIKDSAYYNYSQAHEIFNNLGNDFFSGRMLYNMAIEQADVKDYVGSEATTIQAIKKFKPLNKYKQLYSCYNNLGIIANALQEPDKALQYYEEARFYLEKMDNPESLLTGNTNNIGIVYRDKKDFKKAIQHFEKVLAADSLLQKKPNHFALALNNLALCKIKLMDTSGVSYLINKSIRIKDSLNNVRSLASSYFTFAEYNLLQNDTISGIQNAKKAIALSKESNNNERLLETLSFLSKIDPINAPNYVQDYITLNDSLQKEERQVRNKFARIRFETDEFIAENEQLAREKQLLNQQKQMWTGIAVALFLLGLSVYVIINQRSKNQKLVFQQQQQANNQEIFNLMLAQKQKVDEVKRMEQKRISEELHDGVLGKMLGARMVLTGLNKKSDEEAIKERSSAIIALKNVENEVRTISHELSHTAYQKISNFVDSIKNLLDSVKENVNISTVFYYDEDEDWDSLKGDIKINVYRMIQETLQNAIKHSECSNFFINFERAEDYFLVEMGDDGKGFKMEKEKKGIGIRNISSRIGKLNGTWTIDTVPKKGTTTTLKIPLQLNPVLLDDTKEELTSV